MSTNLLHPEVTLTLYRGQKGGQPLFSTLKKTLNLLGKLGIVSSTIYFCVGRGPNKNIDII